jgi:hypothetical protein
MLKRFLVIGLPLAFLLTFSSAAHAQVLHESKRIGLYSTQAEPGSQNSHPVTLEADRLSAALSRVQARSGETGEVIELFPEKSREELAGRLAKELRDIDRGQDLHLVSYRQVGGFFSGHRNASGARLFVENGRLNMIFGQIDIFFSEFRDPDRPVPPMGSRNRAASLKGRMVRTEGVTFVDGRSDWVALELAQTAPPPSAVTPVASNESPAEPAGENAGDRLGQAGQITWEELEEGLSVLHRLHSKGLITSQEYSAKKTEMLDAMGPGRGGRLTWEELEAGLTTLNRLPAKGLITAEEYDAKKKEMLDAVGPGK